MNAVYFAGEQACPGPKFHDARGRGRAYDVPEKLTASSDVLLNSWATPIDHR